MQPRFNINREKNNSLIAKSYTNDYCYFQFQFHSQIEIYGVTEGEMDMLVDGKRKRLRAGEFSVALSYVGHDYKTPSSSRSFSIIIPPHLSEEFLNEIHGKKLVTPFFDDKELFDKIHKCFLALKEQNASTVKRHGLANVILGLILENAEFVDVNKPANNELITKILFYLNENYKSDISPVSVAEHLGYSQSYVSRYFKSCCGVNLVKYITMLRLKNAITLLSETKHDITYCALESGFSSIRTFYRSFQNEFGCSPKVYMDNLK